MTRAAASVFLNQKTLPRHGTMKAFEADFRTALAELMPRVEELAAELPDDDACAKAALAALAEAHQRLGAQEAPGLKGEFARVKQLAVSVVSLCDHVDLLSGLETCLLCDERIKSEPCEACTRLGPHGGTALFGRVHDPCAARVRRS
ncbi:DUF6415 family natural product biosynthesis protein [Streptomyces sp. SID4985]|uniref:DUF6415 family natural product biosynthesis protein n=1 Tax=Streptomyces sp. SID4985 TaxID=2690292 RepID=UPI00192591A2|nr:DUF6415 family natural product biosynthesis protein [Streptomyces sp. SID4985]